MTTSQLPEVWRQFIELAEKPRLRGSPSADGNPRTALASAGAGGTGGGKRLRQSSRPWTSAATVAGDLERSTRIAKGKLGSSHGGLTSEGRGLSSVAALGAVRRSWEQRLEDARKECDSLGGKLRRTASAHEENEAATKSSFDRRGR
ncbi:MAG TPA: hypothetical protein VFY14_05920 [Streptomyces sp.]|nr:hypothetical protein [Streptomyces sp.]